MMARASARGEDLTQMANGVRRMDSKVVKGGMYRKRKFDNKHPSREKHDV